MAQLSFTAKEEQKSIFLLLLEAAGLGDAAGGCASPMGSLQLLYS